MMDLAHSNEEIIKSFYNLKEQNVSRNFSNFIKNFYKGEVLKSSPNFSNDGLDIRGDKVLYGAFGTPKDVTVPEAIVVIDNFAFFNNKTVENIICPESTIVVFSGAFAGCKNLKSVSFANPTVNIAEKAFNGTAPEVIQIAGKQITCKQLRKFVKGGMSLEHYKTDNRHPGIQCLKLLYEATK